MAIVGVTRKEKKRPEDLRPLAATAGGVLSTAGSIPSPASPFLLGAGAALSLGAQLSEAPKGEEDPKFVQAPQAPVASIPVQQASLDMPDRSLALQRRSDTLQQDPIQGIQDAKDALAQLDLDPETRVRLQKPLDIALQAQRSV